MVAFLGFAALMAAVLLSAELFRRGAYADDSEIRHVAEHGSNSNMLLVWMVALAVLAIVLLEGGR